MIPEGKCCPACERQRQSETRNASGNSALPATTEFSTAISAPSPGVTRDGVNPSHDGRARLGAVPGDNTQFVSNGINVARGGVKGLNGSKETPGAAPPKEYNPATKAATPAISDSSPGQDGAKPTLECK
jgi:hypothetical protein